MSQEISEWAMTANRILFALAYLDERRGFIPLLDALPRLLDVKWEYVSMAEVAEREGRTWEREDFVTLCVEGFEKILGYGDGVRADSHERRAATAASAPAF